MKTRACHDRAFVALRLFGGCLGGVVEPGDAAQNSTAGTEEIQRRAQGGTPGSVRSGSRPGMRVMRIIDVRPVAIIDRKPPLADGRSTAVAVALSSRLEFRSPSSPRRRIEGRELFRARH
jgi:hypothetical protein